MMRNKPGNMMHLQMEKDQAQSKPSRMKSVFITAILQFLCGVILTLSGLVLVYIRYFIFDRGSISNSFFGVAGGLVALISGILGVYASKRIKLLMGYLIGTCCTVTLLLLVTITSSFAAAVHVRYLREHPEDLHGVGESEDYSVSNALLPTPVSPAVRQSVKLSLFLYTLLSVVSALEVVVGTVAGVFCCTGMCEDREQDHSFTYPTTSASGTATPSDV